MKNNSKEPSLEEKIKALCRTGFAVWNGGKLPSVMPTIKTKGDKTVSQLVIEDRESHDHFDHLAVGVAAHNNDFTVKEIKEDIEKAITEVRA